MTLIGQYASAVFATFKRDAQVFLSYRLRVISHVMTIVFTLAMFYYVSKLVRPHAVGPTGRYFAFVVVGLVTMSVLTSALTISEVVRMELLTGNFERMLISPLGPVGGILSVAAFPIAYATVFAGAMLALAAGIFGVPIRPGGILPALAVGLLGALAFASLGLIFVAGLLAYKSSMGASWVLAALGLVGGVYFPITLFPGWIQWIGYVQPFTPAVDLLRHLLVGTPPLEPVWLELVKVTGFTCVLMPVSVTVLWFGINLSRRRGTIMEY
jgi:ABC-2 type transport system permease protein